MQMALLICRLPAIVTIFQESDTIGIFQAQTMASVPELCL